MSATIYYDNDADLSLLKDKTIAILGYGAQGHAQAQNLRDSGCQVVVGQRPGGANFELAKQHGFEPMPLDEATRKADIVNLLLPDEAAADLYRDQIRENLEPGNILMCSHGFNFHFNQIAPPPGVDGLLVAPKGQGHQVRQEFIDGGGCPCLIALYRGAADETRRIGLAYAKAIGGTRGGVIETTFAEETETDLFGEQVVLCGGVSELVKSAFETLVEAGYQPELAYFECVHELKLVVDLLYRGGLSYVRKCISNTAEYGDYTRGPRIINDATREEMRKILHEIQTGQFARDWILENRAGAPSFQAMRRRDRELQVEEVGKRLRRLMTWIDVQEVND